jgi:hypothetical protein
MVEIRGRFGGVYCLHFDPYVVKCINLDKMYSYA